MWFPLFKVVLSPSPKFLKHSFHCGIIGPYHKCGLCVPHEGQLKIPSFFQLGKKARSPKETIKHMYNKWTTAKIDKISKEVKKLLGQNYNLVKGTDMLS